MSAQHFLGAPGILNADEGILAIFLVMRAASQWPSLKYTIHGPKNFFYLFIFWNEITGATSHLHIYALWNWTVRIWIMFFLCVKVSFPVLF